MWRFLERWLAAAPWEVALLIGMPIVLLLIPLGCILTVRTIFGSGIPESLITPIAYAAGVKVLAIIVAVTIIVIVGVIATVAVVVLWLRRQWQALF